MGENGLVHDRLHGADRFRARHQLGLTLSGRRLRRGGDRKYGKGSGERGDPEGDHVTRTSRNMPSSM